MSLFNFKGKENKKPASACACGKCCPKSGAVKPQTHQPTEDKAVGGCITVLGAGCKSCRELYENVKAAAEKMKLSARVEYVTDMRVVAEYGVMSLPAVIVNGKVVSAGKVLKVDAAEGLLKESGF